MKSWKLYFVVCCCLASAISCKTEKKKAKEEKESLQSSVVFSRDGFRIEEQESQLAFYASDLQDIARPDKLIRLGTNAGFQRIVLSSTTQLHFFLELDELNTVVGAPWLEFVKDEAVNMRMERGLLQEVNQGGLLNIEKIISCNPDLFLYDPREPELVNRLEKLGVKCIPFFEYLDVEPLGRYEWLKVAGAITGKLKEAQVKFHVVSDEYSKYLTDSVASLNGKSKVLFGSYYNGIWSAAGGGSFAANLIRDAGHEYALKGAEKGSVDLGMEELVTILDEVDVLGLVHDGVLSRFDLESIDGRLGAKELAGIQTFYCNTAESDYFGRALLEPQVLLQELKAVLSSDALYKGTYFQTLR